MNSPYKAVKVTDDVWWVGAVDWNIRDFHGYSTNRGTTYNAYLVMAREDHAVDTVKAPFRERAARPHRLRRSTRREIRLHRLEPRGDGPLGVPARAVIDAVKPEKVFASQLGAKSARGALPPAVPVTAGQGRREPRPRQLKLTFAETRMLHWPDSMVSWLPGDDVLFSQDGFGMHLATSERFADQIDPSVLELRRRHATYANILLPSRPARRQGPRARARRWASPRRSSPRTTGRSGGRTSGGSSACTPPGRAQKTTAQGARGLRHDVAQHRADGARDRRRARRRRR